MKNKEQLEREQNQNPNRSDFKVYPFGRDNGHPKLEDQRHHCSEKRRRKGQKWKPKEASK